MMKKDKFSFTAKIKENRFTPYVFMLICAGSVYLFLYVFSGSFSPLEHNWYNSYSLQAERWLNGHLDLGRNYSWLEIAVFEGQYFISFPPFPSIVMMPFVLIFGTDTPDHIIALCISVISLIFAYKIAFRFLKDKSQAVFMSLFLILGTNYLHVSLWGAVWYLAQNMAFMFTLIAFYYAVTDNKRHAIISLFALCAAMGCRPFNAVYLPGILYLLFIREYGNRRPGKINRPLNAILYILRYSIPASLLGLFYMWLNYARFGSIFEFGHNYLAEHLYDTYGQFHPSRIFTNLGRMFFNTNLHEQFHGFAMWIASPIFITFAVCLVVYFRNIIKTRTVGIAVGTAGFAVFILPVLVLVHVLLFSMHASLGGHQFGSRYTVDALVAVYVCILFVFEKFPPGKLIYANAPLLIFGLLLNFHGTANFLAFYFR